MVALTHPVAKNAAERPRSNIPQQALVLLNDPVFVEAAKALAERLLKEGQATDAQRLEKIFSLTLTRKPTKQEQTILLELLAATQALPRRREVRPRASFQSESSPSTNPSSPLNWPPGRVSPAMLNLYETTARF